MNEVEEIKERLDIVEYVGRVVQLKKAGRNYKGLCPFHSEKTPSFMVSSEKQIFHCFGCNEGGDIFAFLMKTDGMEFVEALERLASDAGVTLTRKFDSGQKNEREKSFEINEKACKFFEKGLADNIGKRANEYLKKRNISNKLVADFRLGFAPGGNALIRKLLSEGYSKKDLVSAGVAKEKDGQVIDQFRNRVTFPVINPGGRVVGFSARVLDDGLPKYINTPATEIYDKSNLLYGIYQAKEAIRKQDHAIIVEGTTDVIASHQAGVKNAVASSGTALTERQLDILKRFSPNVKLSFDIDQAGLMATKRAVGMAYEKEMNIKVIEIPEGKDAAEVVAKDPKIWVNAAKDAKHVMDYLFDKLFTEDIDKDVLKKKKATKEMISFIDKISDFVERDHYIKKLAKKINVDESHIVKALGSKSVTFKKVDSKKEDKKEGNFRKDIESRLLGLVLDGGSQIGYLFENLGEDDIQSDAEKSLYKKAKKYYSQGNSFDLKEFNKYLGRDGSRDLNVLLMKTGQDVENFDEGTVEEEIFYLVKKIKQLNIKAEKESLTKEIKEAEARKDKNWENKLVKKMQEVIKKEQKI